ncbi:MAG TPA: hypothetical protein VFE61_17005 [Candidatus Sulfotelmatobacter sp.]|nr:hypothetical protein [Candidatus Sulfotelmatobacter sp.]
MALLMLRGGLQRLFPVFLAYTLFEAVEEFTLYGMDVLPSVEDRTFWKAFLVGLIIEGLLKFALTGELFRHLLRPWGAIAKIGNRLITLAGVALVLVAGLTAGFTMSSNPYWLISASHVLQQSMYVIESGLILFIVLFGAYFRLSWDRQTFGIALGLGILSCEHLVVWAIAASGMIASESGILDFANMGTYHVCVLIWMYYMLVPAKVAASSVISLPENGLALWNQELERLLHR